MDLGRPEEREGDSVAQEQLREDSLGLARKKEKLAFLKHKSLSGKDWASLLREQ